jgi:hypothetical protein
MSDAIAIVRPKSRERLLPHLDLDEDSEASEGIYAEELADGAFLLHTFQPFELFAEHPREARAWLLEHFELGDLGAIHDDPRGMLFFDDDVLPDASSYDVIVTALEHEQEGLWITVGEEDDEAADAADELGAGATFDLEGVAELAGKLFDPSRKGQAPTSFEIGQMLEGMQRQLMDSLGVEPEPAIEGEDESEDEKRIVDEEFEPDPGEKKK